MSLDLDLIEEHWKDFGYRSDAVGQASGVIEALITELRASRAKLAKSESARYEAVVEAARLFLINMWDADVDAFPDMEQLRAALAALDSNEV